MRAFSRPAVPAHLRTGDGFTLTEVLLAVVIIGALVAIAVPSFVGQAKDAADSQARQQLVLAYQSVRDAAVDQDGTFSSASQLIGAINTEQQDISASSGAAAPSVAVGPDGRFLVAVNLDADIISLYDRSTAGNVCWLVAGPSETATASCAASVPATAPANLTLPQIVGQPQEGVRLTATQGTWSGDPSSISYQWQRSSDGGSSWSDIPGATDSQYRLARADVGAKLRTRVGAANAAGTASAFSPPTDTVSEGPPVDSARPEVSGTAQQGYLLSAGPGSWSSSTTPSYAYQWQRCDSSGGGCQDVPDASGQTYQLASADVGATMVVAVTATNGAGQTTASSLPTAVVIAGPPLNQATPVVSGTAEEGQALTGDHGSWSGGPTSYSYQWQSSADQTSWTNVVGATTSSYTVQRADIGDYLRLRVTASNQSGPSAPAYSSPTAPVAAAPPVATALPVVSGTTLTGQTLTTTDGSWSSAQTPTFSYQWLRCDANGSSCQDVQGATASSYLLQTADVGHAVRAQVTATTDAGSASATSDFTATVSSSSPANTSPPTISGNAVEGATLTAARGSWTGSGNSYSYQWRRCDAVGSGCADVSGATASTYTVQAADVGAALRVVVSAQNSAGSSSATSDPTAAVTSIPPSNNSAPTVSGTAQQGQTLTGDKGSWAGTGNGYAYRWQRSADSGTTWTDISGATAPTYVVQAADVSDVLRLEVTAANSGGSVTASSTPTAAVLPPAPANTAAPTVSGTAQQGQTLTASQGSWTGSGNSYSYQWQSSPDGSSWSNLAGATTTSYALTTSDVGNRLRFRVTAVNAGGTTQAFSAATVAVVALPPVSTALPAISGTAQEGQTLTVSNGSWSNNPTSYAYQWQRSPDGSSWADVAGGTAPTYTLQAVDVDQQLRALVTATNSGGSASQLANPVTVVATPPVNVTPPTISGTVQLGNTLTASQGSWSSDGSVSYSYQWQRSTDSGASWTDVSGATTSSHDVTADDSGALLRVVVTATNSGGATTKASDPTGAVPFPAPVSTSLPQVNGNTVVGATVTSTTGGWTNSPSSYSYQWSDCDTSGANCVAIGGATSGTYVIQTTDSAKTLKVTVTAANSSGQAAATSDYSTIVSYGYSGAVMSDGPVGYWRLGEASGTTIVDALGQGHSGTYTGSYSLGQTGSIADGDTAVSLSGGWGSVPYYSALNPGAGQGLTMELWYKGSAPATGSAPLIMKSFTSHADPYYQYGIQANGSTVRVIVKTATQGTFTAWDTGVTWPETTQWHYWVVTYDRTTSTLNLYLDGVLKAATSWSGDVSAYSTALGIGDLLNLGSGYNLIGRLDEIAIYTKALSCGTTTIGASCVAGSQIYSHYKAAAGQSPTANVVPSNSSLPTVSGVVQQTQTLTASRGAWSGTNPLSYAFQWQRGANYVGAVTADAPAGFWRLDETSGGTITDALGQGHSGTYTGSLSLNQPGATGDGDTAAAFTGGWGSIPYYSGLNPTAGQGLSMEFWYKTTAAPAQFVLLKGFTSHNDPYYQYGVGNNSGNIRVVVNTTADSTFTPWETGVAWKTDNLWHYYTVTYDRSSNHITLYIDGVQKAQTTKTGDVRPYSTALGLMDILNLGASYTSTGSLDDVAVYPSSLSQTQISNHYSAASTTLTDIAGATSQTYTLGGADVGKVISVKVTATNAYGSASANSTATTAVTVPAPVATALPTISGTAQQSQLLTTTTGSWTNSPTSYAYQWQRSTDSGSTWADVSGATSATYAVQAADVAAVLRVRVFATNSYGTAIAASTQTATVVSTPPQNTAAPTVSQSAGVVTTSNGSWTSTDTVSYSYAWQRSTDGGSNWTTISGATSASYTIQLADSGYLLRSQVKAQNSGGFTFAFSTSLAVTVAPTNTVLPTISGSPYPGQTLTATQGTWVGSGNSYAYQWLRCQTSCANVSGATSSSYVVQAADVESTLEVVVTATNASGSTAATSTPTATVQGGYGQTVLGDSPTLYYRLDQTRSFYDNWETYVSGTSPAWSYVSPGASFVSTTYSGHQVIGTDVNGNQPALAILPNSMPTVRTVSAHLCDCENNGTDTPYPGIVVAFQDANNYDAVYLQAATHYVMYWKVRGGSAASGIIASAVPGVNENAQVNLSVGLDNLGGAEIEVNGATVYKSDVNSSLRPNNWLTGTTKTGVWSWGARQAGTVSWIDDYSVTPGAPNLAGSGNALYLGKFASTPGLGGGSGVSDDGAGSTQFAYPGDLLGAHGTSYSGTPAAFTLETVAIRYAPVPTATVPLAGFSSGPQLDYLTSGVLRCTFPATSGTFYSADTPSSVMNGGAAPWNFYVCTFDGATLKLYLNGSLVASTTPPAGTLVRADATANSIPAEFNVGGFSWYANTDAAGYVDEAAWYLQALTATQVQAHYVARFNGTSQSAPINSSAPTISGTVHDGQTLTAQTGSWTNFPTSYSYQWLRCDAAGANCAAISGATSSTYLLQDADVAKTIKVTVTATNAQGSNSATSTQTAAVGDGYADAVLADSPLGYWRVNEPAGTTAGDAGSSGTTMAYGGGYTLGQSGAFGSAGTAVSLATNGYLEKSSAGATFSIGSRSWSIETWIKTTTTGVIVSRYECGWNGCVGGDGNLNAYYELGLQSSGYPYFLVRSDNGTLISVGTAASGTLNDGRWHHLVGVLDRSAAQMRVYVDGELNAQSSASSLDAANDGSGSPLEIGRIYYSAGVGPGTPSSYVGGTVDDVAVYGSALSTTRVRAHYNAAIAFGSVFQTYGTAIQLDSPVGYWRLSEPASSTSGFDSSGHADSIVYNNTASSAPTFAVTPPLTNTSDTAETWNGSTNYATIPPAAQLNLSTQGSVEAWVKPTNGAVDDQAIAVRADSASNISYGLDLDQISGGNAFRFWVDGDGSWGPSVTVEPATPVVMNQWHYVVGAWDTNGTYLYVDGVLVASSASHVSAFQTGAYLRVGGGVSGWGYFSGSLDELAVYNGALTCGTTTVGQPCLASSQVGKHFAASGWTAPTLITAPTLTGTNQPGSSQSLATNNGGAWSGTPTPTVTWVWQSCDASGNNCTNAQTSGSFYTPPVGSEGTTVRVVVTATNSVGTATATVLSSIVGSPVISTLSQSGNHQAGSLQTANATIVGTPSPTIAYQWQESANGGSSWTNIAGATSSTYTPTAGEDGMVVRVTANASNTYGSASSSSAASPAIDSPAVTAAPTLSPSTPMAGQVETGNAGSWVGSPTPTLTYQWSRCNGTCFSTTPISGATSLNYTPTDADAGFKLMLTVTATNANGSASSSSSKSGATLSSYSAVVLADAPTGYWRLGEASGTSAADATAGGHNGTYTNVALGQVGIPFAGGNTAAAFNGTSSIVSTGLTASTAQLASFTVEAWVKVTGTQTRQQWLAGFSSAQLVIPANLGVPQVGICEASTSTSCTSFVGGTVNSTTAINDGNWHYLVGTYDSTNKLCIRVDAGAPTCNSSSTPPAGISSGTASFLYMGAFPTNTQVFSGSLDEVAFYEGTSLSASQISSHYNRGKNGS